MWRQTLDTSTTSTSLSVAVAVLIIICLFLLGASIYLFYSRRRKNILNKAKNEAKRILMQAIADAKSETALIKSSMESEIKLKKQELDTETCALEEKRKKYLQDIEELSIKEEKNLNAKLENNKLKNKLIREVDQAVEVLEKISEMSIDEAKEKLIMFVESTYMDQLSKELKEKEEKIKLKADEIAKQILIDAMERCHVDVANDKNTTIFKFDDDSLKGKIIGREGRNIKAFQQYGGVDIIIDDVPNRALISSFNPIRREIAYNTLNSLLQAGRLQPALIEESLLVEESKMEEKFYQIGANTVSELEIFDFPDDIIKNLGKLQFRHSYGQNVLQHSVEVAKLAKSIAEALNFDKKLAAKCGLLHDIGKALDFENIGSHVTLGKEIAQINHLDPIIVNAIEAHHGDVEKESVYAAIVAISDAISAARTGARNQNSEEFLTRMKEIEEACLGFSGVTQAFALQSGRQIRVILDPDVVEDYEMKKLIFEIKQKIQAINKTPGEIVITLIREKREYERI